MPVTPFVPLISSGVGMLFGRPKKPKGAPGGGGGPIGSAQDLAPYYAAQTGLAKQAAGQSQAFFDQAMPQLKQAGGYWSTLLNGSRSAMQGAMAPEISALTDTYRGAQKSIDRTAPGAQRDVATAELARQRAGQIGGLALSLRPQAAEQVGELGKFAAGAGADLLNTGANIYGNILGTRTTAGQLDLARNKFSSEQNEAFGNNLSKFLVGLIQAFNGREKGLPKLPVKSGFPKIGTPVNF